MRKLKLEIEALAIESFPTCEVLEAAGTVRAEEMAPTPPYLTCPLWTKPTDCPCTP